MKGDGNWEEAEGEPLGRASGNIPLSDIMVHLVKTTELYIYVKLP